MLSRKRDIQRIKWCAFLCMVITLISTAHANVPQQINFVQAVDLALTANPRVSMSAAKVDAAEASIQQARAKTLPQLDVEANAARSNNPLNVFSYKLAQGRASFADFGFGEFNGPSSLNIMPAALDAPGYYNNFSSGVIINVPIFSGGGDLAKLKRAQSLLKAAQDGNRQAKLALTYDVLQAYEGVRTTTELVSIAKQSLQATDKYRQLTEGLFQQSLVLQSDVLLAQTSYRSAQTMLEAAIAQNDNQRDTFRILIGQPQSDLVPGEAVHLSLPEQSIETLEASAFLSNTQLTSLKALVEANQANVNSAAASYWPQFNFQVRHDWNAPSLTLSAPSNTVMLGMNWAVFNFGARSGAIMQAKAEYQEAIAQWQSARDDVRLAIIQTVRSIQTIASQMQTSDSNRRQSAEMVDILKKKYGQAVSSLGELLDAQSRLDTAKIQQVMTRYNMLLAQAKLLMLVNQLIPESEMANYEKII